MPWLQHKSLAEPDSVFWGLSKPPRAAKDPAERLQTIFERYATEAKEAPDRRRRGPPQGGARSDRAARRRVHRERGHTSASETVLVASP